MVGESLSTRLRQSFGNLLTRHRETILDVPPPICWTAFGDQVALLCGSGASVVLLRLDVAPENGGITATKLDIASFAPSDISALVAPVIQGRKVTSLVTTTSVLVSSHSDPHLPGESGLTILRAEPDKQFCAAAITSRGDIYYAAALRTGGVHIHDSDGNCVAEFPTIHVEQGSGLGFAVQCGTPHGIGPNGSTRYIVWQHGKVVSRGLDPTGRWETSEHEVPGLRAPALHWQARIRAKPGSEGEPIAWHDWHAANSGAYPVDLGTADRPRPVGLLLSGEQPRVAPYGLTNCQLYLRSAPNLMLQRNPDGMRLIDPMTGDPLTETTAWSAPGPIALLSGNSCVAIAEAGEEVAMVAWELNEGLLSKVLRVVISEAPAEGRQAVTPVLGVFDQLPAIETNAGLLIALRIEGASPRLRVWHETAAFRNAKAED